jgi:hypothetical protein
MTPPIIRKTMFQLSMLIFACILIFIVSGFGKIGTPAFTYPPPEVNDASFADLDEPYPAPAHEPGLQAQDTLERNLAYPPPESGQIGGNVLPTLAPIPKDRIVAIYSDGHF